MYQDTKVIELKKICSFLGLHVTGRKAALIESILEHQKANTLKPHTKKETVTKTQSPKATNKKDTPQKDKPVHLTKEALRAKLEEKGVVFARKYEKKQTYLDLYDCLFDRLDLTTANLRQKLEEMKVDLPVKSASKAKHIEYYKQALIKQVSD